MNIGIDLGTICSYIAVKPSVGSAKMIAANDKMIATNDNRVDNYRTLSYVCLDGYWAYIGEIAATMLTNANKKIKIYKNIKQQIGTKNAFTDWEQPIFAETLLALILKKLKNDIRISFATDDIPSITIAIPNDYTEAQKKGVQEASTLAGLSLKSTITEAQAAAWAFKDKWIDAPILVCDIGAEDVFISALVWNNRNYEAKYEKRHPKNGGGYISQNLKKAICRKYDINLMGGTSQDIYFDSFCEELKIQLVTTHKELIHKIIHLDNKVIEISFSQVEFRDCLIPLIKNINSYLQDCISKVNNIQQVILTGETASIKFISKQIVNSLKNISIKYFFIDVHAIAKGAAIYNSESANTILGNNIFRKNSNYTIGIKTMNYSTNKIENTPIIKAGTTLPSAEMGVSLYPSNNQEKIVLDITKTKENHDEPERVAYVILEIPLYENIREIDVKLKYQEDGTLFFTFNYYINNVPKMLNKVFNVFNASHNLGEQKMIVDKFYINNI